MLLFLVRKIIYFVFIVVDRLFHSILHIAN
jgi:hypothetical protein